MCDVYEIVTQKENQRCVPSYIKAGVEAARVFVAFSQFFTPSSFLCPRRAQQTQINGTKKVNTYHMMMRVLRICFGVVGMFHMWSFVYEEDCGSSTTTTF